MNLIKNILARNEFEEKPPVFVDIGASGSIHKKWRSIAKYAICIAFDADSRDFDPSPDVAKKYKKLHIKNALVSESENDETDFYLTKSPYCSSLLIPRTDQLSNWAFSPLFEVVEKIKLKSVDLNSVLNELKIDWIDWYKTDSQGTDLRIFKSLPNSIRQNITVAEFEPGILDAYENEDKLHSVLSYMDSINCYWLAELELKGTLRISHSRFEEIFKRDFTQRLVSKISKSSPGWGEMTYFNSFNRESLSIREVLFGWVCATLQSQHGFAYELACIGMENFDDPLFDNLKKHSRLSLKQSLFSLKYFPLAFGKLFK